VKIVRILVQKYGGTSVSTPEKRKLIVKRVQEAVEEGFKVVLVVSAMGRNGDYYATDTLRSLALQEYSDISLRELDLIMS
jgi:aspartate kinase